MYKTIFFTAQELTLELVNLGVESGYATSYSYAFKEDFPILLSSEIKITVLTDGYDIDIQHTTATLNE